MNIRPETPRDYAAIAAVEARAFGHRAGEPAVVALRRQYTSFDPELSLVAEEDGRVVGHVLFSPESIRLLDETVRAVNLAPIAVDPARQGCGIGTALIMEGHALARAKGFTLSFLLGHPGYYSRLGYRPRAFGAAATVVAAGGLLSGDMHSHPVTEDHIPGLQALWLRQEGGVDFAIDPGPDVLGWISPNPSIQCTVYTRAGVIVGYTRVHAQEPLAPKMFLADGEHAARAIAAELAGRVNAEAGAELVLPLHPSSAAARALGMPTCEAWEAGMACPLSDGPFEDYYARVQSGQRIPGAPVWPVVFDLA